MILERHPSSVRVIKDEKEQRRRLENKISIRAEDVKLKKWMFNLQEQEIFSVCFTKGQT